MTTEEIQALREKALKALAQPEELRAGDKGLRNRSAADAQEALALLEREQAKVSGTTAPRTILVSHGRG